jgi:hypothetical protein
MSLAGLHLQLYQQGHHKPALEPLQVIALKYYLDRLNYAKSWQLFSAELDLDRSAIKFHNRH